MNSPFPAKPLRVGLLIDTVAWAGTERHMLDLALGLRDAGATVQLICPAEASLSRHAATHGLPIQSFARRDFINGRALRTLRRLLRSGSIEVLHAHNGRTRLLAVAAKQLAGRGRCVATQHFLEPAHLAQRGPQAWLSHQAHQQVNARTDGFIAISQAVRDSMLARHEADESQISVVPNGISLPDLDALKSPVEQRAAPESPLVVCVARLEREKDVASLVEAMSLVVRKHPQARCVIAGEGAEKAALFQQIDRLGLGEQVTLAGFVDDALSLMNAADLFVLPSPAEPFGLVLLEAMALGKPVIATRAGGPLEIVDDGVSGVLVPPSDAAVLGEAISSLLQDSARRRDMGQNGLKRLHASYTASQMAQATLAVYQKVIDR